MPQLDGATVVPRTTLKTACHEMLDTFASLNLPVLKPRVFEQTDAGPGVGVSNKQVLYRAAERVRMENTDLYIRLHRASGDCQNPVERMQAAVGRAIVNGDRIHWEQKEMFEGLSEEQKANMSLEEFTQYEDERSQYNVYETCKDLSMRVQDAPGPKGRFYPMTGLVSEKPEEMFFWDTPYLVASINASQSAQKELPGYNYYNKLTKFLSSHFEVGELHMEYRKSDCKLKEGPFCDFCGDHPWVSDEISRVPRPVPGPNGDFLPLERTSLPSGHLV